jgi:D-glycero-D-manno-heptose 1,7-bisphosphate phosphatase
MESRSSSRERRRCPRRHLAAAPNGIERAVFLDRDGVLVDDPGYLSRPDEVRLLTGVAEALARLRAAGWRIVVATNQAGVGHGYFSEEELRQIHERLCALLEARGAAVDAIYYCPHHPTATAAEYRLDCSCRKPLPGLLRAAARELGLNLRECWMIGDRPSDIAAGLRAGCRTVLIDTGSSTPDGDPRAEPDARAGSLHAAAAQILASDCGGASARRRVRSGTARPSPDTRRTPPASGGGDN